MKNDSVILCASSAYNQKYFFNEEFDALPDLVKDELQIMCVMFTEDVGGILYLEFEEEGSLILKTYADERDLLYDDIGSGLKIKEILRTKKELLKSVEVFYKVFFKDEDPSELL